MAFIDEEVILDSSEGSVTFLVTQHRSARLSIRGT